MGANQVDGARPDRRTRLAYQPALDGLRAVAVLAVMLYHGQVAWVRGGWLGVDLFFVLSGYLITSLLLAEWDRSGGIDLKGFWSRRARRLLPALFATLAAVAAYGAFLAPPDTLARLRWDGLATLGYVANWRLLASHQSYFEQFADPSPLRHMWSLGIEEQYYLLWPLLVLGALRLAGGRLRPLLWGTLAAALASALAMAALYRPGGDPSRAYYGTDTRAQALLLGGALALALAHRARRSPRPSLAAPLPRRPLAAPQAALVSPTYPAPRGAPASPAHRAHGAPRAVRWLVDGLGVLGLGGLVAMIVAVPDDARWLYGGGFALAAVAAAAAIAAAVQPAGGLRALLTLAPLPAVGRISYGLYLWHWPTYVVLSPDRTQLDGAALLALRVAVTFALALLSYRLLELPVRRGALRRLRLARPVTVGASAALVTALLLGTGAAAAGGPSAAAGRGEALGDPGRPVGAPAAVAARARPRQAIDFRVYLVGDSVAFRLGYDYQPGTVPGMALDTDAIIGCGVARAANVDQGRVQPLPSQCAAWPSLWRAGVARLRPDVALLVVGAWEVYDKQVGGRTLRVGAPEYERYLDGELRLAYDTLARGSRRIAMLNVPCYRQRETAAGGGAARNDPARVAWLNGVLARFVAARRDRMVLLDLHGFLCPGGRYRDRLDGRRLRDDGVHFSPDGADLVWRWLGPQLRRLAGG
jgi:peptidoglycan/LPS O-acetylase OafA/YrhL